LVALEAGAARFRLITSRGMLDARNVIIAGGPFQRPHIPSIGATLSPAIAQLHSHDYRKPDELPPGRILLVGSGQTGVQLAEELQAAGREVVLSVGRCGRVPRRYRGRDVFWWLRQLATRGRALGAGLPTVADLPSPAARFACNPQLSGHAGGHEVNLRRMAAGGARLVGRLVAAEGTTVRFAPDLADTLRFVDASFAERLQPMFERFVERTGETFPPHESATPITYEPPTVTALDLADERFSTVIWTSGYRPAFEWIELPIFDEFGLPRQDAGRTAVDGLAFIGLPWMVDMGSANLVSLVRDAEALAADW
jgi:putative flavoprotein involved in K+ transport